MWYDPKVKYGLTHVCVPKIKKMKIEHAPKLNQRIHSQVYQGKYENQKKFQLFPFQTITW